MNHENSNEQTAEQLKCLLSSTYLLYVKTHKYHWNVTGPMFTTLHSLFEQHYTELAIAVDEIAERIRTLGYIAPGSFAEFSKYSVIEEDTGNVDANTMITNLVEDQEKIVAAATKVIEAADAANDKASEDLAIRRIDVQQKNAWMLRSHLE